MPLFFLALGQALDFATTYQAITTHGAVELNPGMAAVIAQGWTVFLVVKLGISLTPIPLCMLMSTCASPGFVNRWLWLAAAVTWVPVVGNLYFVAVAAHIF